MPGTQPGWPAEPSSKLPNQRPSRDEHYLRSLHGQLFFPSRCPLFKFLWLPLHPHPGQSCGTTSPPPNYGSRSHSNLQDSLLQGLDASHPPKFPRLPMPSLKLLAGLPPSASPPLSYAQLFCPGQLRGAQLLHSLLHRALPPAPSLELLRHRPFSFGPFLGHPGDSSLRK